MSPKLCTFDAYGTLFDLNSPTRKALTERDQKFGTNLSEKISLDWRSKQLQYSWIRAITGSHTDFWNVTIQSLDWALENANLKDDKDLRLTLLELYETIDVYPEVPELLDTLKQRGLTIAILSNGSPQMLSQAVESSGINQYFDSLISVEEVGIFKPSNKVYELVTKQYNCSPQDILFVSSNGWDASAASGFGFHTAWVNRMNEPVDNLPWKPQHVISSLSELSNLIN